MIDKELFKKVRYIELKTKGLVNSIFGGEYHSAFKGMGISFSEVRPYTYGDDIRQIDWNVSARANELYLKIFEEEREQTLFLCIDVSASEFWGSYQQKKIDYIYEVCSILAFSAIKNKDKVGLLLFSDQVEIVIPPKKGRTHVMRLIRELYCCNPQGKGTDIAIALRYINQLLNRRSVIVLISDFHAKEYEKEIKITNRKHDLVSIMVVDPFEMMLPSLGIVPMLDAETQRTIWIDTANKKLRKHHAQRAKDHFDKVKKFLSFYQIDAVELKTNEPYIKPLMHFFQKRILRKNT